MEIHRREFIRWLSYLGVGAVLPIIPACSRDVDTINVTIQSPSSNRAHQLRDKKFIEHFVQKRLQVDYLIVGAGISGLSTAYHLKQSGKNNFLIIDLENLVGGNASAGENEYSAYPRGAHYLTQINLGNPALLDFLKSEKIITEISDDGRIIYNEMDLCFDPEERLYIKATFQDGLIPNYSLQAKAIEEFDRFFALINTYKWEKGEDDKYFFDIPKGNTSTDKKWDALDQISFKTFLEQAAFKDPYLIWYLNYCCRDDFGGNIEMVSAWAGISYFAAHKPAPSNTDASRVLTWPEGNFKLVTLMFNHFKDNFRPECLLSNVTLKDNKVLATVIDFKQSECLTISCDHCILAIPPFVSKHILDPTINYPRHLVEQMKHTPWAIATVILKEIPVARGHQLSWDNVAVNTKSLGYIYNQHQHLNQVKNKICISIYIPFDGQDLSLERKQMQAMESAEWKALVLKELETMHPNITTVVEAIEIWKLGHGMIMPTVGLIKGEILKQLSKSIEGCIHFAHTDLIGYSTFEEGFDLGFQLVKKLTAQHEN